MQKAKIFLSEGEYELKCTPTRLKLNFNQAHEQLSQQFHNVFVCVLKMILKNALNWSNFLKLCIKFPSKKMRASKKIPNSPPIYVSLRFSSKTFHARVKALGKSVKFNPLCMQRVCKHKYMRNIQMNRTLTLNVRCSRWKHQLSSEILTESEAQKKKSNE